MRAHLLETHDAQHAIHQVYEHTTHRISCCHSSIEKEFAIDTLYAPPPLSRQPLAYLLTPAASACFVAVVSFASLIVLPPPLLPRSHLISLAVSDCRQRLFATSVCR